MPMINELQTRVACALNDVAEDLWHVATLLRCDLHLLLLLVYGVGALSSGLVIGVNYSIPSAICCSACAYLLVTYAVLRAAEAARGNEDREAAHSLPQICNEDITRIIEDIPVEKYVVDADLNSCSISQLRSMLAMKRPRSCHDPGWVKAMRDPNIDKTELLEYVRKYKSMQSDTCAICFEDYIANDAVKVLPRCGHRFHPACVESWARTFVTPPGSRSRSCNHKGCPTCPLCNGKIGLKIKEA